MALNEARTTMGVSTYRAIVDFLKRVGECRDGGPCEDALDELMTDADKLLHTLGEHDDDTE